MQAENDALQQELRKFRKWKQRLIIWTDRFKTMLQPNAITLIAYDVNIVITWRYHVFVQYDVFFLNLPGKQIEIGLWNDGYTQKVNKNKVVWKRTIIILTSYYPRMQRCQRHLCFFAMVCFPHVLILLQVLRVKKTYLSFESMWTLHNGSLLAKTLKWSKCKGS